MGSTYTKNTGRGQLVARLAGQVGDKGKAIAILKARGHMNDDGSLTKEGQRRNNMTAAERAKDREAKRSPNHSPADYVYDTNTNKARLRARRGKK